MKYQIIIIATIINLTFSVEASVLTVSNQLNGGAQYSSILTAYTAATNGDTILIEGSNINYNMGSTDWAKQLTIIGNGYNTNKQNFMRTTIEESIWGIRFTNGSSGSSFFGVCFYNTVTTLSSLSDFMFQDCVFQGQISIDNPITNFLFSNCAFYTSPNNDIAFNNQGANILLTNCIFNGCIQGNGGAYTFNATIDHCIFMQPNASNVLNALQNTTIKNCIFYNTANFGSLSSCAFNNNIFRNAVSMPPSGAGNSASGNLNGTDPFFVNAPVSTVYSYPSTFDFNLQIGSAAINTADDGTDIGIHGGTSHFSEKGEVLINPVIRNVIINNTNVAPNGNLNVHINATKPTDH